LLKVVDDLLVIVPLALFDRVGAAAGLSVWHQALFGFHEAHRERTHVRSDIEHVGKELSTQSAADISGEQA
jgi:hypothetical protein